MADASPPASVAFGDRSVARLGLGTMSLTGPGTWGPPADREGARRLLRRAVELGVELFDTADSYGPGASEEAIADALHPYPGNVLVATKGGLTRQGPRRWAKDASPEHLRTACEESLRRLRVERIELYQLHAVDPAVPLEESLGALVELREEGKIALIGVCNIDRGEFERALAVTEIASVQNRYSLADRSSESVLERCEQLGIPFLAWAPLAKGQLAGEGKALARIAARHGATAGQVALAWLLHRSPVLAPIPGTASERHLEENVAASALRLSADERSQLDAQRFLQYEAGRRLRRARALAGAARRRLPGRER